MGVDRCSWKGVVEVNTFEYCCFTSTCFITAGLLHHKYTDTVVLKPWEASDSLRGLLQHRSLDSTPRISDSGGLKIYILNKFISDVDVTGPVTTLGKPLRRCVVDSQSKGIIFTISKMYLTEGFLKARVLSTFSICWPGSHSSQWIINECLHVVKGTSGQRTTWSTNNVLLLVEFTPPSSIMTKFCSEVSKQTNSHLLLLVIKQGRS